MKRFMSVLVFLLLACGSFFGIWQYAKGQEEKKREENHPIDKVVIVTDFPSGTLEPIGEAFYAEKGIQFEISYRSTADFLKGSKGNKEGAPADVYISSQDMLMKLADSGHLTPYASQYTDTALNLFKDEEAYWTGLWVDPVVFAVNSDFARTHPAFAYTWDEVCTRQSVELSMTDFIAADMSKDMLMCMAEHFGPEYTFFLLARAQQHLVQYGKYLSTPSRMAAMGKCDIGISGLNEAIRTRMEDMPLAIHYPEDGSPWYLYGIGLAAESAHPERAAALIDWLLTPYHYKSVMEKNRLYYIYVNDDKIKPDAAGNELAFWELEKRYFDEGRKDLLNQWGEKIRFGGSKS